MRILVLSMALLMLFVQVDLSHARKGNVVLTVTARQREALLLSSSSSSWNLESVFGSKFIQTLQNTFHEQGFVIIRGLIEPDLLHRLQVAAQVQLDKTTDKPGTTEFVSFEFGPLFAGVQDENHLMAFYEAAVTSAVPQLIAKILLNNDNIKRNETSRPESTLSQPCRRLRVLKDALLCKGPEPGFCGWHVDDWVFWPTIADESSSEPGVNAWIALDDMPAKWGGSIALSPASHVADWRHQAYKAIGSTPTLDAETGLVLGSESSKKGVLNTCKMAELAPELAQRMEKSRAVFDFEKGDVLFHTRWLFHRSLPVNDKGLAYFAKRGQKVALKRYSIRYELGSAKLQRGMSMEPSILMNPRNRGKTLDEVCENDGPWYPQCSPEGATSASINATRQRVVAKLEEVEKRRQQAFQKIMPYVVPSSE